jgi:site-specific DNA-methyltransferase (adenine-specific)
VSVRLEHGDCREVIKTMADCSVDSCVTDPPYSLQTINKRFAKVGRNDKTWSKSGPHQRTARGFMNQKWDTGETAFDPAWWSEVYRVLKPGAHLVAFSGTRTYHRMACAIEDAGFEIRDQLGWAFATGFPKSHDVSKGIDKAAGATREVIEEGPTVRRIRPGADQGKDGTWEKLGDRTYTHAVTAPATADAAIWEGWGTAIKPAWEPICLARKPLSESTVAANVLKWGTGALNIDGCRVEFAGDGDEVESKGKNQHGDFGTGPMTNRVYGKFSKDRENYDPTGRWPANLLLDGSDDVLAAFPGCGSSSAARFFFSAKADADDRCDSKHPTVKPVALMRWLARLVTPPGGLVLDPFSGSGTTGVACLREGFECILIEREDQYAADIRHRIAKLSGLDAPLFTGVVA